MPTLAAVKTLMKASGNCNVSYLWHCSVERSQVRDLANSSGQHTYVTYCNISYCGTPIGVPPCVA